MSAWCIYREMIPLLRIRCSHFPERCWKSLIANNIVPLWQPGIWPVENLLSKNIRKKYEKMCALKNKFFTAKYSHSPNDHRVNMNDIFSTGILQQLTNEWFNEKIEIRPADLERKANESSPSLF